MTRLSGSGQRSRFRLRLVRVRLGLNARHDQARLGLFSGEVSPQKIQKGLAASPSIVPIERHAIEKHQDREDVGITRPRKAELLSLFFVKSLNRVAKPRVDRAGIKGFGLALVMNPARQRLERLYLGIERLLSIAVRRPGNGNSSFKNPLANGAQQPSVLSQEVLVDTNVLVWKILGFKVALIISLSRLFKVAAVEGTVDGDLPLRSAAA